MPGNHAMNERRLCSRRGEEKNRPPNEIKTKVCCTPLVCLQHTLCCIQNTLQRCVAIAFTYLPYCEQHTKVLLCIFAPKHLQSDTKQQWILCMQAMQRHSNGLSSSSTSRCGPLCYCCCLMMGGGGSSSTTTTIITIATILLFCWMHCICGR